MGCDPKGGCKNIVKGHEEVPGNHAVSLCRLQCRQPAWRPHAARGTGSTQHCERSLSGERDRDCVGERLCDERVEGHELQQPDNYPDGSQCEKLRTTVLDNLRCSC